MVSLANLGGLALALGLAWLAATALAPTPSAPRSVQLDRDTVPLPDDACAPAPPPCRGLRDASGTIVPLRLFTRIVSGNLVADRLLLELVEPTRIAAFSPFASSLVEPHRYAGHPQLGSLEDVEGLLTHKPDLFIVNGMANRGHVGRLRQAGVAVFDLGSMQGLPTLRDNILTLSRLLAEPTRGHALAATLDNRLSALRRSQPPTRRRGIYVGIHGSKMYGGTSGTSYHDVLTYGGLDDAAADAFTGWPAYTHEDLLRLNPDVVVTQEGMRHQLCSHPGLHQLEACQKEGHFLELPSALLTDPGLSVVDAAFAVANWLGRIPPLPPAPAAEAAR